MTYAEQPRRLSDRLVVLEPTRVEDAGALFASVRDPEVWRWKLVPRPAAVGELERLIADVMIGPGRWPFTIRRATDGALIGSTTLGNFDWHHGCVEMGFTWLDRASWGQGFNEATKLLLLRFCFEELALARVELQVDERNERSVLALRRLGFAYEGMMRSRHLRPDGTRRNSLVFSALAEEWPDLEVALAAACTARGSGGPT